MFYKEFDIKCITWCIQIVGVYIRSHTSQTFECDLSSLYSKLKEMHLVIKMLVA